MKLGIDIGSGLLKAALIDKDTITILPPVHVEGNPARALRNLLNNPILSKKTPKSIGITGTSGKEISDLIGLEYVDEITTSINATRRLHPKAKTIFEIGRENSRYILLKQKGLEEYSMNTKCAAGTGSFLDNKAQRSGKTLQEFENTARKSTNPAPIAGRCVVFAETDMVHHFQEGIPEKDIIAGMYKSLAKNFVSTTIPKNSPIKSEIIFIGGVSQSDIILKYLKDELKRQRNITKEEIKVPEHNLSYHAIGAALSSNPQQDIASALKRLYAQAKKKRKISTWTRLELKKSRILEPEQYQFPEKKIKGYLGLDVGSVSTKAAITDHKGKVIASDYIYTKLNPAQAVKDLMKKLQERIKGKVDIAGAATCGSGRFMNAVLIGADEIIDEISAQGLGCMAIHPQVDTIFEIGGQDSKYLKLDKGTLEMFEMNKECAAGTGSFLEEQCTALGILKQNGKPDLDRFGELALQARSPVNTGERCTVFMESAVVQHQQDNVEVENICAGLCISVAQNYINRVVEGKPIGDNVMFTGAVAKYKGLIAAFEKLTKKQIIVPNECKLTGAIGAALAAKRATHHKSTCFAGFDNIIQSKVDLTTSICEECANVCRISSAHITRPDGKEDIYYTGDRCGKFSAKTTKKRNSIPDYFQQREKLLSQSHKTPKTGAKTVGLIRTMMHNDYFPFWNAFLLELGFRPVLSDRTNKKIVEDGVEIVSGEPCFPQKVAHGHIKNLLDKKPDHILLPAIEEPDIPTQEKAYACPYVQGSPYVFNAVFNTNKQIFLTPKLNFKKAGKEFEEELIKLGQHLGKTPNEVHDAIAEAESALQRFRTTIRQNDRQAMKELAGKEAYVLIGRPYHYDAGICLDLWKRMQDDLGVPVLPMDFIPLDTESIDHPNMYWHYGKAILAAAHTINRSYKDKQMPDLRPIFMTNFGCGPNSFIYPFFKKACTIPPIIISIDEHTAAAGIITRYQAGHMMRRSLTQSENHKEQKPKK